MALNIDESDEESEGDDDDEEEEDDGLDIYEDDGLEEVDEIDEVSKIQFYSLVSAGTCTFMLLTLALRVEN